MKRAFLLFAVIPLSLGCILASDAIADLGGRWTVFVHAGIFQTQPPVYCDYSGFADISQPNPDSINGQVTIACQSPCPQECPAQLTPDIACDVNEPQLDCTLTNFPYGPLQSKGLLTGLDSAQGLFLDTEVGFEGYWRANRQAAVPALDRWGMLIFVLLTGFTVWFALRRRGKLKC